MDSETTIFDLPAEDILEGHIFIYLSIQDLTNLYFVSKQMRESVKSALKRRTELILNEDDGIDENKFAILVDCCENLRVLNLSGVRWITDKYSRPLLERNAHLVHLNLAFCRRLTFDGIEPFVTQCKDLKRLEIQHCKFVSREFLSLLCKFNPYLEHVNIRGCNVFDLDDAVIIFKKQQKYLKTFLYSVFTCFPPYPRLDRDD